MTAAASGGDAESDLRGVTRGKFWCVSINGGSGIREGPACCKGADEARAEDHQAGWDP